MNINSTSVDVSEPIGNSKTIQTKIVPSKVTKNLSSTSLLELEDEEKIRKRRHEKSRINQSMFVKRKVVPPNDENTKNILEKSFELRKNFNNSLFPITPYMAHKEDVTKSENTWQFSTISFSGPNETPVGNTKMLQLSDSISSTKIVKYTPNHSVSVPLDRKWVNPVLGCHKVLPSVVNRKGVLNRKSFDQVCCTLSFTKAMLNNLYVVGQVDDKFIACVFQDNNLFALIDQHAAHERIRLEKLLKQVGYYTTSMNTKSIKNSVTRLVPPAELFFYKNEVDLIMHYQQELNDIGLVVSTLKSKQSVRQNVYILSVPSIFVNVCSKQAQVKGSVVNAELLKEFINERLKYMQNTSGKCNMSSTTVFKVLASHACHGAIKFGDKLSFGTCQNMMEELSKCDLPFQCAHGRPSIAPLLKLNFLEKICRSPLNSKPNLAKLTKKLFNE